MVSENQVELPKGFSDPDQIRVVPDPVFYDSIRIQVHGPARNQFSLIWNRVRNVNYGSILYDVVIGIPGSAPIRMSTSDNYVILSDHFANERPYTRFLVAVSATTKWAKSG